MKTMTVGEFKAQFSAVIEKVKGGEEIEVTYGKQKKVVGYFKPSKPLKNKKRKLGVLQGRAKAIFKKGFKLTEEEFISL